MQFPLKKETAIRFLNPDSNYQNSFRSVLIQFSLIRRILNEQIQRNYYKIYFFSFSAVIGIVIWRKIQSRVEISEFIPIEVLNKIISFNVLLWFILLYSFYVLCNRVSCLIRIKKQTVKLKYSEKRKEINVRAS